MAERDRRVHVPAGAEAEEQRARSVERVEVVVLRTEVQPPGGVLERRAVDAELGGAAALDPEGPPFGPRFWVEGDDPRARPVGPREDEAAPGDGQPPAHEASD